MAFTLVEERDLPELSSLARLYVHDATGARVLSLVNSDENKSFGISFRTPPERSDGVAHILEHSVLCGSERYPVKEPFVELIKGSLNTFLNAFTYPDKTVYPLASTNLRDFYNLIEVYFDAVFHPLISEDTFRQEGWHYEIDSETGALSYKGVVFNEMKGAYSDPDDLHDDLCRRSLFPDTAYGLDSGGDPVVIPSLDYAAFRRFHETYYHPSNAYIFFYGDDDPKTRLAIVERWLAPYARLEVDSLPGLQPPFPSPRRQVSHYEGSEQKAWTAVNWALPGREDAERTLALSILSHVLVGTPASPLRVALIDSGLGEDLAGFGLEDDIRQGAFSVGLKGVAPADAPKVEDLVLSSLRDLAEKGIDREAVAASLNTVEFALREKNTGRFPRGLATMLEALGEWLYGGNPLDALAFSGPLERIKRAVGLSDEAPVHGEPAGLAAPETDRADGYFESLIRSVLLENPHRTTVILLPDPELGTRLQAAERATLETAKAAMGPEALAEAASAAARLKAKQERPDSPEALATIPALSLADLPADAAPLPCAIEELAGSTVLFHDLATSSILYLDLAFQLEGLADGLLPYAGLFGRALLEMGAGDMDYIALSREIGKETGGIHATTLSTSLWGRPGMAARFILRAKTLVSKTDRLFSLLDTILKSARLDDRERFRQIVLEEKAQAEASLIPSGHRVLGLRLKSRLTAADALSERLGGVEQLLFLRRLAAKVEEDWAGVLADLEAVRSSLLSARETIFNVTVDAPSYAGIKPALEQFIVGLSSASSRAQVADGPAAASLPQSPGAFQKLEFLTAPTQVNFVGTALPLDLSGCRRGAFLVAKNYLDTTYLWEKVRVQGGAYGGFSSFDLASGVFLFLSYRDPNLERSFEAFSGAEAFLRNLELSPEELARAIVGTIGGVDAYLLPDAKGFTSLVHHLTGLRYEDRQQTRRQILSASREDFAALAEALASARARAVSGALGSKQRIEALPAEFREGAQTTIVL